MLRAIIRCLPALAFAFAAIAQTQPNPDLGFKDTPILPGQKWHVHDPDRPYPPVLKPGSTPGAPPSDAIILFDGKDLSKWGHAGSGPAAARLVDTKWPVKDGYFEVQTGSGQLVSRDKFGDIQLHVEWSSPNPPVGTSQGRGNSGILIMGLYEVQVLDMYNNITYADGGAGAIYGQWPPLATVPRPPGEWNVYDIVFEAPKFDGDKLVKPAYQTVFWNGVVLHNHKEVMGPMVYRNVARYRPHEPEGPIALQDHKNPVRYRNIWVRRLGSYN